MFKIYIDRLEGDRTEKINITTDSAFLDINEKELCFNDSVAIRGQAEMQNDFLILRLQIETVYESICSVCNRLTKQKLILKNCNFCIPRSDIKQAAFDFQDLARQAILLEIPAFLECNEGNCKERKNVEQFTKKPKGDTHFPFANLRR